MYPLAASWLLECITIDLHEIYYNLGHLLTCQCHGAERCLKKCHFSDRVNA